MPGTLKGANVLNVTTAGTRVQLPNIPCKTVTVIAKRTNTGSIFCGMNTVNNTTVYGVELEQKETYDFDVFNANEIWIDASVSGEGVSYVAV
jgi:hypothetical protein